ncbi:MAG: FMN-binding negative transcriptional regulator [Alphaproteobacteria bacterium]|nr:FMN-binding negative transcriptional regulator [Alphaproteobacteria bacterium]
MYRPPAFRVDDVPRLHGLMRERPFATLVSAGGAGLLASHLPTVLRDDGPLGVIECHCARANPQWREFVTGADALMIFHGVEAYVTPRWYPSKAAHGKVVPTWNYVTVHAYGRAQAVEDGDWLRRQIEALTRQQERGAAEPWAVADAPADFTAVQIRGIVGIRIEITRLEGKWKLSQNRAHKDRAGVVAGLRARGEGDDHTLADAVERAIE